MKSPLVQWAALAIAAFVPALSFAQASSAPVTRAQVREQLIQLEQAGYKPMKLRYPADIQAAEAHVAASGGTTTTAAANTGVGGSSGAASQSGHAMLAPGWHSMYGRH